MTIVRPIVARVGDRHTNGAGNIADHSLGPFDGDDTDRGQVLIEADLVEVGAIERYRSTWMSGSLPPRYS